MHLKQFQAAMNLFSPCVGFVKSVRVRPRGWNEVPGTDLDRFIKDDENREDPVDGGSRRKGEFSLAALHSPFAAAQEEA